MSECDIASDHLLGFLSNPITWKPRVEEENIDDENAGSTLGPLGPYEDNFPGATSKSHVHQNNGLCDISSDLIFNPYVANALDVVRFNILFDKDVYEQKRITQVFAPTMAHQVFGTDEVIMGYRNLLIKFTILPNSFHMAMEYSYTSIADNASRGEIAEDINARLVDWFPHLQKIDELNELAKTENLLQIHGDIIVKFPLKDLNGEVSNIYITKCDPRNEAFMNFHKRFQSLIVFFIDAASVIDFTDYNWNYYYVYKDVLHGGEVIATLPIGFSTVYEFTRSQRARVAQFFILPSYQKQGLGFRLLSVIYKQFWLRDEFKYITVENPCEEFSMLRDKLDLRLVISMPEFERERVLDGYVPSMGISAQRAHKLSGLQVRHLVAVLGCYYAKDNAQQRDAFVLRLKKATQETYRKKFSAALRKSASEERIARLKRIVDEDCVLNRTIHREVCAYVRRIYRHMDFIESMLA